MQFACAGQASSSTGRLLAFDSSLGCNRDFKGILYIWRPCFRKKK